MSQEDLDRLEAMMEEMKRRDPEDIAAHVDINYQFHNLIYSSTGNNVLYKLIEQTWAMAPRTKSIFLLFPERIPTAIKEHEKICQCLKNRDAEGAKRAFVEHKRKAFDLLIQYQGPSGTIDFRGSKVLSDKASK